MHVQYSKEVKNMEILRHFMKNHLVIILKFVVDKYLVMPTDKFIVLTTFSLHFKVVCHRHSILLGLKRIAKFISIEPWLNLDNKTKMLR